MGSDPFDGDLPPTWLTGDPWERELRELLSRMDRSVNTIVVEGPNDRRGLRAGGVTTTIAECSTGSGIDTLSRKLTDEPIAILTDYDDHGRRLNGQLRDRLPDAAVEPQWRRDLGLLLTQRGRYDIEALRNIFDREL